MVYPDGTHRRRDGGLFSSDHKSKQQQLFCGGRLHIWPQDLSQLYMWLKVSTAASSWSHQSDPKPSWFKFSRGHWHILTGLPLFPLMEWPRNPFITINIAAFNCHSGLRAPTERHQLFLCYFLVNHHERTQRPPEADCLSRSLFSSSFLPFLPLEAPSNIQ